ncbi:unnamed protein product [Danaus chrysippus]|uniref:(African queen) hypothetical protein n=1 Tax=Danaus chrysippus TaxID=151541 RepID=A0A8J2RHS6_9NEOP|nr:unnamed protein product [Danaus chrysippus]
MAFPLPRFEKCCCCLPLRTGSLLIGYVSIVFSLLSISGISYSLFRVITFVQNNENPPDQEHSKEEYDRITISLYISHGYILFVYLYYTVINVMLIIGVHLNKIIILKYYVYCAWLVLVLASATVVISTVLLHFIATIALLKWCLIIFYCLLVVRSTFLQMEERNKPREFEMQNLYMPQRAPLLL